jgi:hypothetical protein
MKYTRVTFLGASNLKHHFFINICLSIYLLITCSDYLIEFDLAQYYALSWILVRTFWFLFNSVNFKGFTAEIKWTSVCVCACTCIFLGDFDRFWWNMKYCLLHLYCYYHVKVSFTSAYLSLILCKFVCISIELFYIFWWNSIQSTSVITELTFSVYHSV